MRWQEACDKSPFGQAHRYDKQRDVTFIRMSVDYIKVQNKRFSDRYTTVSDRSVVEGFTDWEPSTA